MLIRPVVADDWKAYRALRLRALCESPDAFGSTYESESNRGDAEWSERISAVAASRCAQAFFALQHDEVCGLVWCKASDGDEGLVELFQMWVAPEVRGSGAGHMLLEQAIAWAKCYGAQRIRLGVTIADSPAMSLYKSAGFQPIGMPERLREGSVLMSQNMELNLSA